MEVPIFTAQRAADLKRGQFYRGREVAHVSPIGGGVVLIRFAAGDVLKVMGDEPLTDLAQLQDTRRALELAIRQVRYLHQIGAMPTWPATLDNIRLAADMLWRTAESDAEYRAATDTIETMTVGVKALLTTYAEDPLPSADLLDEYDRDDAMCRAEAAEMRR